MSFAACSLTHEYLRLPFFFFLPFLQMTYSQGLVGRGQPYLRQSFFFFLLAAKSARCSPKPTGTRPLTPTAPATTARPRDTERRESTDDTDLASLSKRRLSTKTPFNHTVSGLRDVSGWASC